MARSEPAMRKENFLVVEANKGNEADDADDAAAEGIARVRRKEKLERRRALSPIA